MDFFRKDLVEIVQRASTISERLEARFIFNEAQKSNAIVNVRIEQWCQVAAQGNWEKFEQRLVWDALDLSRVCRVLGSVRMNEERQLPAWAETLDECLKASASVTLETLEWGTSEKNRFLAPHNQAPFEEVFLPFIYVARQKLIAQVGSHYDLLSESAHANLEHSLLKWLSYLCSLSLELEFSVFRASRQSTVARLKGNLTGNHSGRQYQDFIKDLLAGRLLAFFKEYSVLARLVATVTDLWVDATEELISRLASDWSEIQKTFQAETELGQVVAVKPFLSDRHHSGRSVTAIMFASGLKLVYKPKDLGIEQAYTELLAWLNEHDVPLPFKVFKVVNRSGYGWVEFVKALPCKDQEEVRRYYQRAGMILCLAYVFEATDLHFENVIACGEQPVLIDLETLMHPWVQEVEAPKVAQRIQSLANQQLWHSVLRTGFLPLWQFSLETQSYDASGLGAASEQEISFGVPKWHNINTDNMVLGSEYGKTQQLANAPSLNGVALKLNDYIEEIVSGFQKMYWFLTEHRQAILAPDGPLTAFDHQSIRFVFRPTKVYGFLLAKTLEPKFLRDGVDRSIQLDILSRVMLLSDNKPRFWPLLRAEQQALEQMDIPLFTARSDSDALLIAPDQAIDKCFTEPSFNLVVSRLNQLNDEDLEQQIGLIRGSLNARITDEAHYSLQPQNSIVNLDTASSLTPQEAIQQAIALATDLQKRAIRSTDGSATWIAPQYVLGAKRFQLQPIGSNLYDGSCGIALFLAALEKVSNGAGFRNLALGALQPFRQDLWDSTAAYIPTTMGIGGASGCGSIIYGLVRVSQFLEEPTLLKDAKRLACLITPAVIAADQTFDIISGSAGLILGLLALHDISADTEVLEQAITCGHHLLNHRVASDSGYRTWIALDGKLLTGFSHGAAGIAYALLRLYQATGEAAFLDAAQEAIAYEGSVFIYKQANWPDFREASTKESTTCMCSWCHGAPGIGLARVAGLDMLDTDEIRQDIEVAVNTTKQHQLSIMDHLCCGNLGRVEFLLTAARKVSQPQLLETAMEQAAQVVFRAKQRGTFNYNPSLGYTPGLFQGAAGIGYELLRLAHPDLLPSVLLWE
ncbi:MAG TPA: type 2 lantipeptide synthetase LanM [Cyanobacteria bacterium UBA11369]|nr:type 2 lantipeptide synthetase LanM [Cyanobacteria bacterium UBA11371]HBE48973.1 type 2 lantipeptide synthetase LanM [Cyanobacteria bacterium UBA11369]